MAYADQTCAGESPRRGTRRGRGRRASRPRPGLATLAVVASMATACCALAPAPSAAAGTGGPGKPRPAMTASGVVGGALFGGDEPFVQEQGAIRRDLAIVRAYFSIGEKFPTASVRPLMANGSTLLVSLAAQPGETYANIAAGKYDASISAFLRGMEQAAVTYHLPAIYFDFEHEANLPRNAWLGSAARFVAAWDHIHQLAAAADLDWNQGGRLHWVLILNHEAYVPMADRRRWQMDYGTAGAYFPGPSEVDVIAADGYNTSVCMRVRPSRPPYVDPGTAMTTPRALFGPLVNFAAQHGGLPVFIAEWGTISYTSPLIQASFIRRMMGFVTQNHSIAAALYWDSAAAGTACDFSIDSNPDAVSAMKAMGQSPALRGRLAPLP